VTDEPTASPARPRLWVEIAMTLGFYLVYSAVRNQFGSELGDEAKQAAYDNALDVIAVEKAIGLYHEEWVQALFIDWTWFIRFWNIFYGTAHFIVTIAVMVFLFLRFPRRYLMWRTVLACTTGLALIGFAAYPLMPPRLLPECESEFGACDPEHEYVDTLVDPGGWWSFDSGTMQSISNQYAAMPSLHIAWASWCALALYPVLRKRWQRILALAYPAATLFTIVVTANHYWIDGIGGLVVLAAGYAMARPLSKVLPGIPGDRDASAVSDAAAAPGHSSDSPQR